MRRALSTDGAALQGMGRADSIKYGAEPPPSGVALSCLRIQVGNPDGGA